MERRYVAGTTLLNQLDVVEWSTGHTLVQGFSTRADAEAAAKAASVAYRAGFCAAQEEMRRALGIEADD